VEVKNQAAEAEALVNHLGQTQWLRCLQCNNNSRKLPQNKLVPLKKLGKLLKLSVRNNKPVRLLNKVKPLLVSNSVSMALSNKLQTKHHLPLHNRLRRLLALAQSLVVADKQAKLKKPHQWVLVVLAQ
jgi:hypothetical protein